MKIHNVEQNTLDWMKLHVGIPTASGISQLLTPEFELRKGETPRSYVAKKVTEAYRNKPLIGFTGGFSVEQGSIVERFARPAFTFETGIKVAKVGFITTDDGKFGCSPDGLITEEDGSISGVEIKCPNPETHVRYLIDGVIPKDYIGQVFSSMYASDAESWWFMSHRYEFPPLIIKVERDEKIMAQIKRAVDSFWTQFEFMMKRVRSYDHFNPFRDSSSSTFDLSPFTRERTDKSKDDLPRVDKSKHVKK